MNDTIETPLDEAIRVAGSQTALAAQISERIERVVTQQNISWWVNRCSGKVPDYAVLAVEDATGVSRHRLRADVFGAEPKAA